ncbi:unnamed protein product [Absidia cylindrospora]
MDSEERRQQRIESICNDYLVGETPVLVCTLMKGPFISSPWNDKKRSLRATAPEKSHLQTFEMTNVLPSPRRPPPPPQEVLTSTHDESTQEFDSDNERTIPYDVYDMEDDEPENTNINISSSPPS